LAQDGPAGEKANRFAETTDFQPRSPLNRLAAPSLHGTRIDLSAFVSERKPAFFSPAFSFFLFIIFLSLSLSLFLPSFFFSARSRSSF